MRKIKIKPIISNLKDDAKEHFKDCLITFPSNTLVLG